MKIRRIALVAVIPLLFVLAGGCSLILSRDYLVITPHLENRGDEVSGSELRAETYDELKKSILHLIEDGVDEGIIRLYNYIGDAEGDSESAIKDIMNYEPLGAYAVEYMSYRCARILSYYEVTVSITYQKTPEQISAIKSVDSFSAFKELVGSAFANYEDSLVVLVPWYYEDKYNIKEILDAEYYNNPLDIPVPPSYTLKVFPDIESGQQDSAWQVYDWQRILEISFRYPRPAEELRQLSKDLYLRTDHLLPDSDLPDGTDGIRLLEEVVIDNAEPLPDPGIEEIGGSGNPDKDEAYTAYGALINGAARSEGYALAFKTLCLRSDVECQVIQGSFNGYLHCWNLVLLDNGWYHVDSYQDDVTGTRNYLLKTDAQMADSGYKWNSSSYPASAGSELSLSIEEMFASENPSENTDLPVNDGSSESGDGGV